MIARVVDLTWGDKVIPVKISYYALSQMDTETGVAVTEIASDDGFNLKAMESLFFHAMISGCHARGIDPICSREDSPFVWEDVFVEFARVATDELIRKQPKDNGAKKKSQKTLASKN